LNHAFQVLSRPRAVIYMATKRGLMIPFRF
jgi:hypothetical protein